MIIIYFYLTLLALITCLLWSKTYAAVTPLSVGLGTYHADVVTTMLNLPKVFCSSQLKNVTMKLSSISIGAGKRTFLKARLRKSYHSALVHINLQSKADAMWLIPYAVAGEATKKV